MCIRDRVKLPVLGKHMVTNALLAAAVGKAFGMTALEIASGLNGVELTSGRLRKFETNGVSVIDDTYNANPESVMAGIETLSELNLSNGGQHIAVLGAMGELGEYTQQAYEDAGRLAASLNVKIVSVGNDTQKISEGAAAAGGKAEHFSSVEDAARHLKAECEAGDAVLFKGSRAAGMEKVMKLTFD